MNSTVSKTTSFLIAFLVLFSTFSFTVDRHYCGGSLIAISYIGKTEVCKSDIKDGFSVKIKGCCSDEVQTIEGQDELQIHASKKLATKEQFVATNLIFHKILFVDEFPENDTYKELSLENIPLNYQVLHQCFLI
jgi:hypothetical protein